MCQKRHNTDDVDHGNCRGPFGGPDKYRTITLCEECTPENHRPGGILWGLIKSVRHYAASAFMNTVRWYIFRRLRQEIASLGPDVTVHVTCGAATKAARAQLRLEKSHTNGACAIGRFHPAKRTQCRHFRKHRRNNRDRVMIDRRTGGNARGASLGCSRTRRNPQNSRCWRGD